MIRDHVIPSGHSTRGADDTHEKRHRARRNGKMREEASVSPDPEGALSHVSTFHQSDTFPNLVGNTQQHRFNTILVLPSGGKMSHRE